MTIHSAFLALSIIASTACIAAPPATNGQGVSHPANQSPDEVAGSPTAESRPAPATGFRPASNDESGPVQVSDCVPLPNEQREPRQEIVGLRVQDFRVIEPLVAGGTGRISVALAETSGIGHYAYPGIRSSSDSATIEASAQLYGIGGCDVSRFQLAVILDPDVRPGDTIELNFQPANLACMRGDYPCEGEIVSFPVQVVGR